MDADIRMALEALRGEMRRDMALAAQAAAAAAEAAARAAIDTAQEDGWEVEGAGEMMGYDNEETAAVVGGGLPWTITLTDTEGVWTCGFRNCGYTWGPVTRVIGETDEFALAADDGAGDYYVGVKINTETGLVDPALLCSKTASDVYDAAPPSDEFFKKLLYVLTYAAVPDTDPVEYKWTVKAGWYRLLPELGRRV